MTDLIMTAGTELDAIVPEVWSAAFYPTLKAKLPFNDSISADYEGEITALGDTVNVATFPQFDHAEEILENQAVAADAVTPSKTQLVVNKQVAKDYILTKKALRQSIDAQAKLRDLAFYSIMKKMQALIIAEIVPSPTAPDHAISFDSSTTLQLADMLEAKELLDDADCEDFGRVMITGVAQNNDLFNITGFVSRDFIQAGSPLSEGAISTPVLGFTPKSTSELGNVAYFFHPIFLQGAVQQMPEVSVHDLGADGKRATRVNIDVLFGIKQFSNVRVVQVG